MTRTARFGFVALIVFLVSAGNARAAGKPPDATIVFDVKLREFRCWTEEDLAKVRTTPCDKNVGWHPITGDLYFKRAQVVNILLINATAQDLLELDIKADDLTEPSAPIAGSLSQLSKLVPVPSAPTVVTGNNVVLAGRATRIKPKDIYSLLTTADNKDFKDWAQSTLIDPLMAKEVGDFLAIDLKSADERLNLAVPGTMAHDIPALQGELRNISTPTTTSGLVQSSRALVMLIERELAFREHLALSGVVVSGGILNTARTASLSAPLQAALDIDAAEFLEIVNKFETGFPNRTRYGQIRGIAIKNDRLVVDGAADEFLGPVNDAAKHPLEKNVDQRVKDNLLTLSAMCTNVVLAERRRAALGKALDIIEKQKDAANGVFALQRELSALADDTVQRALELNVRARTIPLEEDLQVRRVGQWFASKTITVGVKQGQRVALFDLSAVNDTTGTSVTGTDNPAAKAALGDPSALATVRTLQFPIYNMYHMQLGLGFLRSTAENKQFQVDTETTGSGSSPTTKKYIDQTVDRGYTLLTTANLIVFPAARHAFPWRPRYDGEPKPKCYSNVGAMLGFSVTSPGRDFIVGGAWLPPTSPVGLQFGWHIALRDYPPDGVNAGDELTTRVITLKQRRVNGFSFGLVVTTDLFSNVFASIFKAS